MYRSLQFEMPCKQKDGLYLRENPQPFPLPSKLFSEPAPNLTTGSHESRALSVIYAVENWGMAL